jgi:hypothetical protein
VSAAHARLSVCSTNLLESCFAAKKFNEILFLSTRGLPDADLINVIDCMLAEVLGDRHSVARLIKKSGSFYCGRHQTKLIAFLFANSTESAAMAHKVLDHKRQPSDISDLDAVIILEWVSRVVFLNRRRADCIWPLVHGMFHLAECGYNSSSLRAPSAYPPTFSRRDLRLLSVSHRKSSRCSDPCGDASDPSGGLR